LLKSQAAQVFPNTAIFIPRDPLKWFDVLGRSCCLQRRMRAMFFAGLSVLMLAGCANVSQVASNGTAPASQSQTSDWGPVENGLRCRVTLPAAIEQGMSIPATVEVEAVPGQLPVGVEKVDALTRDPFLSLTLTDENTGKQFKIKPLYFFGPFTDESDHNLEVLDQPLKPWAVHFPLVAMYSNLVSADYTCQVTFIYPTNRLWWKDKWVDQKSAFETNWWHGTIVSGNAQLQVLQETPKVQTFWIPKRLVVTKEIVNLHPSDLPVLMAAIPIIRFHKADAETVSMPVRNGHVIWTEIERPGGGLSSGGALVPDDINPIDELYSYKGQNLALDYRIEVVETEPADGDLYIPGPGSPDYRLIWSRSLHISITAKEFQQLPASVVNVPAGTAHDACMALIRANPEVEELSLEKAQIGDADMAEISRLKHLRALALYDTHITDAGLAPLEGMTHLQALYLDGTKVTDAGVLKLRRLTQLEKLGLGDTAITDKGAAVVSGFKHLKQLNLCNTQVGDITAARLSNLKHLEWLDLRETRVTDKGARELADLHIQELRLPAGVGGEDGE
jgi:hypothetical protein